MASFVLISIGDHAHHMHTKHPGKSLQGNLNWQYIHAERAKQGGKLNLYLY